MKTIYEQTINEIEVEKSKFIGYLFHCENTEYFKEKVKDIKKEFPKATHYCYGYCINQAMKSNDDVVDTLARNGADMNKKDKTGKSANDYGEIAYHKKQQTQNQDQPQQDTNVDQKLQQQNIARKDIITHLVDTGKANLNARTADKQQQTATDIANKFHDNDMYKFLKSRGGKTSNELDSSKDKMNQKSNKESTEEDIEESFKPKLNPNRARYDDSYMEYLKNLAKLREQPKKECGCCGGGVSIGSAGLDGVAAVTPGSTKKKK